MKHLQKLSYFTVICLLWFCLVIFAIVMVTGCVQPMPTANGQFTNPPIFGPEWLDAIIEIANAASLANLASTPVNPYAIPISIAFAGIAAVLEALRRKEKSGRKNAEQKLNGGNNNK